MSSTLESMRYLGSPTLASWLGTGTTVTSRFGESKTTKQFTLLRILAIAHEQRLDAGRLVANLAEEYRGSYRRRLHRLADRLASGTPLAAALEQTPGILASDCVLTLQFASQTGTLPQAFTSLQRQSHADYLIANPSQRKVSESLAYVVVVSITTLLVITFMMIFIIPTLAKISGAFRVPMPGSLVALIDASNWVANYWFLPALLVIAVIFIGSTQSAKKLFRDLSLPWLRPTGAIRSAELLRLLSLTTEAGRPLPAALSALGRYHFDAGTRQKLLVARNEVEQGEDVWKSLADAQLLTVNESSGLAALDDGPSRAWAMRRLAESKLDQVSWRRHTFNTLLHPILILMLAAIVAWVGFAMMQFLSEMILHIG